MIAPDPFWYKDAIIYELHVKAFADSNDDGDRRLPGPDQQARLPPGAGGHLHLAPAVLPFAAARRRLRHRRLPRGPSQLRHAEAVPPVRPRGAPAGHPGRDRAGDQPHLRPAPVVPGRPAGARRARRSATSTSGATPTPSTPSARIIFTDTRDLELDLGPGREGLLLAPVLPPPARPELRQPAGPPRRLQGDAVLARHGGRRDAARRDPLPDRARGDQLREPRREPRGHQADPPRARRPLPRQDAPGRGEPVARRRARLTSATATSATWRSTSR